MMGYCREVAALCGCHSRRVALSPRIGRGLLYIERKIAVSPCAMPRTVRLDARVVLARCVNRPSFTLAFGYAQFLLRSSAH